MLNTFETEERVQCTCNYSSRAKGEWDFGRSRGNGQKFSKTEGRLQLTFKKPSKYQAG